MIKRVFDALIALMALVVLWPVLVSIAIAVKLDSAGPVLFRQERVGRHGTTFKIRKFRTMVSDARGPLITTADDPRVTRLGRFLRGTKLDELPQLIDVLAGTMSVVGPRPEVASYVALWPNHLREVILSVRPGITDPVTVELRNESDLLFGVEDPELHYVQVLLPIKAAAYVRYVETWSFRGDVQILMRTVVKVFRPRRPG